MSVRVDQEFRSGSAADDDGVAVAQAVATARADLQENVGGGGDLGFLGCDQAGVREDVDVGALDSGAVGAVRDGFDEGLNTAASPSMSWLASSASRSMGSALSRRLEMIAASICAETATRSIRAWIWLPA